MKRVAAVAVLLLLAACSRTNVTTTEGDEPSSPAPNTVSCPSPAAAGAMPCDQAIAIADAQTGFWDRGGIKVRATTAERSGTTIPVWIVTYPDVPLVKFAPGGGCGIADYSLSVAATDGATLAAGPTEQVSKATCHVVPTTTTLQFPPGNDKRVLSPGTVNGFLSVDQILGAGQSNEWLPGPTHIWSGRFAQVGKTADDSYRNHPAFVFEYNYGGQGCGVPMDTAPGAGTPSAIPSPTDCRSWMTYDAIDGALISVAG